MPTYSYACKDCGHAFDIQQAFTDDALTRCPECGGSLRKIFSAVGVVFKGSGFYRTDSRGSGSGSAVPGGKSAASGGSGSGGSGSVSSGSDSASGSGGAPAGGSSGTSGSTSTGSTGSSSPTSSTSASRSSTGAA